MTDFKRIASASGPVAIGGIGGAGTRIIASLLLICGVQLGTDLNESLDNLWFTLLFKRRSILVETEASFAALYWGFAQKMSTGRFPDALAAEVSRLAARIEQEHPSDWFRERARTLLAPDAPPRRAAWGWKEPNTHVFAERLLQLDRRLLYIHAVRHPLDMAASRNNNQIHLWSDIFLDNPDASDYARKVNYWCAVQAHAEGIGERFGDRVIMVRYEDVMAHPERAATALCARLGLSLTPARLEKFIASLEPQHAERRWTAEDLKRMDAEKMQFVRARGYDLG